MTICLDKTTHKDNHMMRRNISCPWHKLQKLKRLGADLVKKIEHVFNRFFFLQIQDKKKYELFAASTFINGNTDL